MVAEWANAHIAELMETAGMAVNSQSAITHHHHHH
jgi:ferrochelatase